MVRVGVVGASGYTGGELLRLLLLHPKVEITQLTSREYAGEYVFRVHPNLRGITTLKFERPNLKTLIDNCEFIFTATPHGVSSKFIPHLLEVGLKIADLSADFRLKNPEDYPKWYGWNHPHPELLGKAVYGLPEIHREEIKGAQLVACPGCMAVAGILALAPPVKAGIISMEKIVLDVKMGSSGAGVKPSRSTHHAERYGVVRPYKPVGHRHTAEVEQELKHISGGTNVRVAMSAHAVNIVRGILATCHTFLRGEVDQAGIWKIYRDFYRGEPFIRMVKDRRGVCRLPDPKAVVGSNYCDLGFEVDRHTGRLVALSAIDNLLKGASGVAVQNMNLMLGFPEDLGLKQPALYPV